MKVFGCNVLVVQFVSIFVNDEMSVHLPGDDWRN